MTGPVGPVRGGFELDRERQITCDACEYEFAPLKNFSVWKWLLLGFLYFPALKYLRSHFICPKCGRNLYHRLGEFKTGPWD